MTEIEQRALNMIEKFGSKQGAIDVALTRAEFADDPSFWRAVASAIEGATQWSGKNVELAPETANSRD